MLLSHSPHLVAKNLRAQLTAASQSTRPSASLVAATLSTGVAVAQTGFHLQGLLIGTAMWSVTAFGFVINDILDYEKDKAACVDRPIAADKLSLTHATALAIFLLSIALGISTILGVGGGVLAATVLALILYTPAVRHLTLFKGAYVAALCVVPLYYAAIVVHGRYSLLLFGPIAAFIVGRETLMDANELDGDRHAGLRTLAVIFGRSRCRWLGASLMVVALAWLTLATVSSVGRTAGAISLMLILLILMWPRLQEDRRIALSRLPMFAAAAALAFG